MRRSRSSASDLDVGRALIGSMIASGMSSCIQNTGRSLVKGARRTLQEWIRLTDTVNILLTMLIIRSDLPSVIEDFLNATLLSVIYLASTFLSG